MMIRKTLVFGLLLGCLVMPTSVDAAFWHKKKKPVVEEKAPDSDYKKLTGSDTTSVTGILKVINKNGKYYFEIPTHRMGKDMLVVNRLTRVPAELNEAGVNRGVNYETQMVRFGISDDKKRVVLRQQRPLPYAPAGDAIGRSIADNFISPIIATFDIEAYNSDSTTVVIQVTDLYNGKETSVNNVFSNINIHTSAKSDLSRIISIKAYDNNVVAKSELTTKVTEGNESVYITVEVSSSLALLPEDPMPVRLDSPRIGYFTTDVLGFSDDQQKVDKLHYIQRWRLVPSDTAAYLSGKTVRPVKPIKFYVDSRVPVKWRKYLMKGITDWNYAFEKIGFKDAIVAEMLPDSVAADADDINYSTLMYAASTKMNAMGPSTLDPRTGEILEADIMWWHNVLSMLQQWLTVQTGAVNPAVRATVLPDDVMGDAIRFVICHEVGHSLGLRHNMIASAAFPTDSLRSKTFTDRMNCTAASIMDYARYNYVAQPSDGVTKLSPNIGPYDLLAIEYGYRWFGTKSVEAERADLAALLAAHKGDLYRYSEAQSSRDAVDPRALSEDLGDDAVKSATCGIRNLKIVMDNVVRWTTTGEPGQTYDEASRLHYAVVNQWNNYMYHVLANVGGIYLENTNVGDGQATFTFVPREKQREAVQFLIDNVFTYQKWLFGSDLGRFTFLNKNTPRGVVEYAPSQIMRNAQAYLFYDLMENDRLMRMLENEMQNGKKAYTAVDLMNDLHRSIFAVTIAGGVPDVVTRNTQKLFVDALITAAASVEGIKVNKRIADTDGCLATADETLAMLWGERILDADDHALCSCGDDHERMGRRRELSFYGSQINRTSDAISVKRGELLRIRDLLKRNAAIADEAARYHYKDLILRIDNALDVKQ
ncbi:MAG: zinc-dependent metalloprotease [Muribaculaceae bacterium]